MELLHTELIRELSEKIAGKNVLLLGFGREGRASLEAVRVAGNAASITIADKREIAPSEVSDDVKLKCGEDYQKAIGESDFVIKSPGVVLEGDYNELTKNGRIITSEAELFLEAYGHHTIGITGTKGKSTTTTLIYHILKEAGKKTVLLGNIGIPPFERVTEIEPDSFIVFEMSCHQLEYNHFSPHRAVYLNLYPEHLDHYGTFEKYKAAKENIYRNQDEGDFLYCGEEVYPEPGTCRSGITEIYYDDLIHISENDVPLKGRHNLFDMTVAATVAEDLGISTETIKAALRSYKPLPHRLEYCGTFNGIRYYDDSISTIPETCIEALNTVKNVETVLIGGMDRGIDYSKLIDYLKGSYVEHIVLMEATGKRIFGEMKKSAPELIDSGRAVLVDHLSDAVEYGKKVTGDGGALVLSPAAASYGIFKNFEERGDAFKKLIQ